MIQDSVIIVDRDNSKWPRLFESDLEPRGFGFVTFTEYSSVEKALDVIAHKINEKIVSD